MKLFVPGRICLFGEHSDWAGGYRRINARIEKGFTLITGTNQGIYAEVQAHPSHLSVTSRLPDGSQAGPWEAPMDRDVLLEEAQQGGFFSYVAGVAYQVLTHYAVKGLRIDCSCMDLPIKKGLSSSAAICVLTSRAFNHVYDLKMTRRGEMEYAYLGEIVTPSRCGRMDQGCAFGQRPVLMTFDGDRLDTEEVSVGGPLYYFIVDLKASKDTVRILSDLNHCYPFPQSDLEQRVQDCLGSVNRRIVHEAADAVRVGDARRLGGLMTEAQRLFDEMVAPACPAELDAPVLHTLLDWEPLQQYIWGGKGVGSQGDGTAQFLARDAICREEAIERIESEMGMDCLRLDVAPPIGVRKAIIPVAGFGTRLYPASKATKKEFFPVVDRDGVAKPVIHLIVEEALSAGIENVCLITQEEDKTLFDAYFNARISIQNYHKLSTRFRDYAEYLSQIGGRVAFTVQDRQEGFGHAVFCAREWVGDEPFLLLLGDHLYRSASAVSCARQILDVYEKTQTSTIGLMRTPESAIANFGTVMGDWIEPGRLLNITEFSEKPTVEYAREKLQVEGVPQGEYLTVFGQYVIRPEIFAILAEQIESNLRERGEFQLTSALEALRCTEGFIGLVVDGRRYDIGTPAAYVRSIGEFARDDL